MSLTRQLFNEFRPFFRMFDDAAFRPFAVQPSRRFRSQEFDDPFESLFARSSSSFGRAAKVELKEEGSNYVIEAEVPGVKKEHLDVTVGDHGRSITIEGRVFARSADSQQPRSAADATSSSELAASQAVQGGDASSSSNAVTQQQQGGSEVAATASGGQQWETRSSFSRTIWLPRPVDSSKVSGKLEDGVLRLEIPKMADEEEGGRTRINVQ
ncbi:hypothetical protein FRC01_002575 [Tulasnella sp. 417]|nr:hypothetical protein FRC01_002575 [Tulasnella sp. 417]